MNSPLLASLYAAYQIETLPFGIIHDKLGDVYEEYCVRVLSDNEILRNLQERKPVDGLDIAVFKELLGTYGINNYYEIKNISATTQIPHRETHGLSKTDVIMTIQYSNGVEERKAISCKQSSVAKVAFAEFDVDTICREVGISDERLKALLLKHQTDASAKYMSSDEKQELRESMAPIARRFVRWVITGSPDENPTKLVYPTSIIKFNVKKPVGRNIDVRNGDFSLLSFKGYSIEDYLDTIMTKNGKIKSGGFGTGLSWTYATGSKGVKIQFKA